MWNTSWSTRWSSRLSGDEETSGLLPSKVEFDNMKKGSVASVAFTLANGEWVCLAPILFVCVYDGNSTHLILLSPHSVSFSFFSIFLSYFLPQGTIGAGMLGLPYFMNAMGVALGASLLVLFACLTNISYRYLHMATLLSKWDVKRGCFGSVWCDSYVCKCRQPTYDLIGFSTYGTFGAVGVIVATIGINFGAMISYILLLGGWSEKIR